MPMAINSLEEYEKVINVSWFIQDQPIEELACVLTPHDNMLAINSGQVSLCAPVLADVPTMLHRHKEFSQPVLLLFRRSFSAFRCYRRNTQEGRFGRAIRSVVAL